MTATTIGVMQFKRQVVAFDTDDMETESAFWAKMLGGTVARSDDWHSVVVDGETRVGVQLAPNHVRPEWPDGQPQQVHIDLYVDDIAEGHDYVIERGAVFLKKRSGPEGESGFRVYADPAGHPFCLCWGQG